MEKMLSRLIGEDIELITVAAAEPAGIRTDPGFFFFFLPTRYPVRRSERPYLRAASKSATRMTALAEILAHSFRTFRALPWAIPRL
jgi:hypothetical protein